MTHEERFMHFFETLTPETLAQIDTLFAENARFKDPFNDVIGVKAIHLVFTHMFATTTSPRFTIKHSASQNQHLFIHWVFTFNKKNTAWQIDGSSLVHFNKQGKVQEHRDYWDPAEQIYSKVTGLKTLMKFLVRHLKAQ